MKTMIIKIATSALLLALTACVSQPMISSETREGASLVGYKSYGFVAQPGTDKDGYSTILTSHFKAAVHKEMQARGYQFEPNKPDVLVNFFSQVDNRTTTSSSPSIGYGYYGSRNGVLVSFPVLHQNIETRNYKVGTVNIDVIDASRNELVWQGVLEGALSQKAMKDPAGAIQSAVTQIFSKYPK